MEKSSPSIYRDVHGLGYLENKFLSEEQDLCLQYGVNVSLPLLISTGFLKYPLELKKKIQLELKKNFS